MQLFGDDGPAAEWSHDHKHPLGAAVPPDVAETAPGEPLIDVQHNSIAIRLSREMAILYGLVEPTDEERAQMAADAEQHRVEEAARRAQPGPKLTLEALLERLDWTPEYAQHYLHPACWCTPTSDDPDLCSWARELGFDRIGGAPT